MKYADLTEEQRDNMTYILKFYFELGDKVSALVHQQAQKEEIRDLEEIKSELSIIKQGDIEDKIKQLKFESELE